MKKAVKITIIVSVILVLAGVICFAAGAANVGFDFRELSTKAEYIKKNKETDKEFSDIYVSTIDDDIELRKSEDNKTRIEYYVREGDEEGYYFDMDKGLRIEQKENEKWYEKIKLFEFNESHKLIIFLPEKNYDEINAASVSGNYKSTVPLKIKNDISINLISGNITAEKIEADRKINLYSTSGNIHIDSIKSNNISILSVSGDADIKNIDAKDSAEIKTTSGSIKLNKASAEKKFTAESISGDIEGKTGLGGTYSAESVSGEIRIPDNDKQSQCQYKFKTVSGDIKITND